MKIKLFIREGKYMVITFFACLFLSIMSYAIWGVAPFGNKLTLTLDFNHQYLSFLTELRQMMLSGKLPLYTWHGGLGQNFIATFAMYMASPVNLLAILFPENSMPYALTVIQFMKMALAATSFAFYAKRKLNSRTGVVILFSLLYGMMSYAITYAIHIAWLDGLIWLPLIVYNIDRLIERDKIHGAIISLAVLYISNFYIGYMISIFSILYFIYALICSSYSINLKFMLKKGVLLAVAFIIAAGCSAFLLLPTWLFIKDGTSLLGQPLPMWSENLSMIPEMITKIYIGSYDSVTTSSAPNIYCGLFSSLLLLLLYFSKNKNISIKQKIASFSVLLVLVFSMVLAPIDRIWHAMDAPNWYPFRYSFILSFFSLMLTCRYFDEIIDNMSWLKLIACSLLFALGYLFSVFWTEENTPDTTRLINIVFVLLYSISILSFRYFKLNRKIFIAILLSLISIELTLNTNLLLSAQDAELSFYKKDQYYTIYDYEHRIVEDITSELPDDSRVEMSIISNYNQPQKYGYNGLTYYTTMNNRKLNNALYLLGYGANGLGDDMICFNLNTLAANAYLGLQYIISDQDLSDLYIPCKSYQYLNAYENPYAFPIIFSSRKINSEFGNFENDVLDHQNMLIESLNSINSYKCFDAIESSNVFIDESTYRNSILTEQFIKSLYIVIPNVGVRNYSIAVDGIEVISKSYHNAWRRYEYLSNIPEGSEIALTFGAIDADSFAFAHMMDSTIFYVFNESALSIAYDKAWSSLKALTHNGSSINASIDVGENEAIMTTIPYDRGWAVKVDGNSVELDASLDAFISLEVAAGNHEIELSFFPYGMRVGIAISILSVTALIINVFWGRRKKQ